MQSIRDAPAKFDDLSRGAALENLMVPQGVLAYEGDLPVSVGKLCHYLIDN